MDQQDRGTKRKHSSKEGPSSKKARSKEKGTHPLALLKITALVVAFAEMTSEWTGLARVCKAWNAAWNLLEATKLRLPTKCPIPTARLAEVHTVDLRYKERNEIYALLKTTPNACEVSLTARTKQSFFTGFTTPTKGLLWRQLRGDSTRHDNCTITSLTLHFPKKCQVEIDVTKFEYLPNLVSLHIDGYSLAFSELLVVGPKGNLPRLKCLTILHAQLYTSTSPQILIESDMNLLVLDENNSGDVTVSDKCTVDTLRIQTSSEGDSVRFVRGPVWKGPYPGSFVVGCKGGAGYSSTFNTLLRYMTEYNPQGLTLPMCSIELREDVPTIPRTLVRCPRTRLGDLITPLLREMHESDSFALLMCSGLIGELTIKVPSHKHVLNMLRLTDRVAFGNRDDDYDYDEDELDGYNEEDDTPEGDKVVCEKLPRIFLGSQENNVRHRFHLRRTPEHVWFLRLLGVGY